MTQEQELCEGDDACENPVVTTHRGMNVCESCKDYWNAQDKADTDYMMYDSPHPNIYND